MGKAHAARALRISQRLHVLSACMLAWQVHWLELENDDGTDICKCVPLPRTNFLSISTSQFLKAQLHV
jgi:hypothetical protein